MSASLGRVGAAELLLVEIVAGGRRAGGAESAEWRRWSVGKIKSLEKETKRPRAGGGGGSSDGLKR